MLLSQLFSWHLSSISLMLLAGLVTLALSFLPKGGLQK